MQKLKSLLITLPIALLVAAAISVPVYARDGEDSGGNSGSGSTSTTSEQESEDTAPDSSPNSTETEQETEQHQSDSVSAEDVQKVETEVHHKGRQLLQQAKQEHKQERTAAQRQKVCEARKTGIEHRTTALLAAAKRHLNRINNVYTKVQAYKTDKNVSVANWDSLVASADAAKAQAAASVAALENAKPSVDCTSDTLADSIATYKAATAQARTDIQNYRKAVKNILSALESAKTGDNQ